MKKILMTLVMALLSASAFATFQYSVVESPVQGVWDDGGQDNGVYGYAYTIQVTEGTGSIYIVDKINNLYSMSGNNERLSLKADMSSTTKYGWVDVASGTKQTAEGSTTTFYNHQKNENNDLVTQTGYKLGEFSAGDEIGVWLTPNGKNYTGASVFHKNNPVNSNQMTFRDAYVGTDATGMNLHQLDFKDGVGSIFFGLAGVASPEPIGQPLPGVVTTFALGLCGFGMFGKNKRKKK